MTTAACRIKSSAKFLLEAMAHFYRETFSLATGVFLTSAGVSPHNSILPLLRLVAVLSGVLFLQTSAPARGLIEVHPAIRTNAVLANPDMGWVLYENYPVDPDPHGSSTMLTLPEDDFPEASAVALMFSWQDIEKAPHQYDFSQVDHAYDYWKKRGKEIQLRLSTESLVWWSRRNPPAGAGVPPHVLALIPPEQKQTREMDGIPYVVVDANNTNYLMQLKQFLQAVNAHFDSSRPVTLIDLRGFGVWGEWHSGYKYPDLPTRRSALKKIVQTWAGCFPDHALALSGSYDPDGPPEYHGGSYRFQEPINQPQYLEFLRFSAFDLALLHTNITLRRDGCGGAVHSNERKLFEDTFTRLRRAPMMSEFLGGYAETKKGGSNWVTWMIQDALSLHPNYINLLGWQGADARLFIAERPDLVKRGALEMGYRLTPLSFVYPERVRNKQPFEIKSSWTNLGTGRALHDCTLSISFLNERGELLGPAVSSTVLPISTWIKGITNTLVSRVSFQNLPRGKGTLAISLPSRDRGQRIALPLDPANFDDKVYPVGPIVLAK